jgi:hypothetical protein
VGAGPNSPEAIAEAMSWPNPCEPELLLFLDAAKTAPPPIAAPAPIATLPPVDFGIRPLVAEEALVAADLAEDPNPIFKNILAP